MQHTQKGQRNPAEKLFSLGLLWRAFKIGALIGIIITLFVFGNEKLIKFQLQYLPYLIVTFSVLTSIGTLAASISLFLHRWKQRYRDVCASGSVFHLGLFVVSIGAALGLLWIRYNGLIPLLTLVGNPMFYLPWAIWTLSIYAALFLFIYCPKKGLNLWLFITALVIVLAWPSGGEGIVSAIKTLPDSSYLFGIIRDCCHPPPIGPFLIIAPLYHPLIILTTVVFYTILTYITLLIFPFGGVVWKRIAKKHLTDETGRPHSPNS